MKVGCTLAVAAGAATCSATVTLYAATVDEWYPPGAEDHDSMLDICPHPEMTFEVEVTSGTVSDREMVALRSPPGFEDIFLVQYFEYGRSLGFPGISEHHHPLFAALVRQTEHCFRECRPKSI